MYSINQSIVNKVNSITIDSGLTYAISDAAKATIEYTCQKVPTLEWCGYVYYTKDDNQVYIHEIVPLMIGTHSTVRLDMEQESHRKNWEEHIFSGRFVEGQIQGFIHSHHNMETNPSGTDLEEIEEKVGVTGDSYLSVICNNRGSLNVMLGSKLTLPTKQEILVIEKLQNGSVKTLEVPDYITTYVEHILEAKKKETITPAYYPYTQGYQTYYTNNKKTLPIDFFDNDEDEMTLKHTLGSADLPKGLNLSNYLHQSVDHPWYGIVKFYSEDAKHYAEELEDLVDTYRKYLEGGRYVEMTREEIEHGIKELKDTVMEELTKAKMPMKDIIAINNRIAKMIRNPEELEKPIPEHIFIHYILCLCQVM